ncbi:unnamed protein product [Trichobilharzia regenti]|nr:unnamed protein product [Trichobilharzia regenti]
MERDRDRSNLPPSVICLNRPKYMYSNLSMSTEDYHYDGAYRTHHGNDDNDDDDLRNYTVIKRKPSEHHHYYIPIHTVRENSYTESMVINSPQKDYEYPLNKKRQENSIHYKSTKSSPSYYYITPTPKHKLSTSNAWDTEYTSTELEQNEAKSYDYHNPAKQNDNQPFIRDINNRKSSRRSARITELVNLLTKNLDEENKHNTHGVNHKNR